jgi:pyruvate dehydrogenase E2 component (dihydrolipoamide acetyltransferase)
MTEHSLSPDDLSASSDDLRVNRRDVEALIQSSRSATPKPDEGRGSSHIRFSRIRRLTAEHMVKSKTISAHTLMVREIDYGKVESVRRLKGESFKAAEGCSLTYLSFSACATVAALRNFPHLNSSVVDDGLALHPCVNLGIAVDLGEKGLIVPVIAHAEELSLRQMSRAIADCALRARSSKLTNDDLSNGTFTITNPGPYGTLITGAIINQPQVAILATDGVSRVPRVRVTPEGDEAIAITSVGNLSITFDHRAVDGAYAARFLDEIDVIMNSRDWSAELEIEGPTQ